jgi:hypothetical protein
VLACFMFLHAGRLEWIVHRVNVFAFTRESCIVVDVSQVRIVA